MWNSQYNEWKTGHVATYRYFKNKDNMIAYIDACLLYGKITLKSGRKKKVSDK